MNEQCRTIVGGANDRDTRRSGADHTKVIDGTARQMQNVLGNLESRHNIMGISFMLSCRRDGMWMAEGHAAGSERLGSCGYQNWMKMCGFERWFLC
jgi:hypothetical protein